MSATDELRRMLDERGIKYTIDDSEYYEIIEWQGPYNLWWQFLYDPYEEEPYGEIRLRDVGAATHIRPEQAIAATVGRSCESCPEMDNPDSYIRHLQSALKWHDEHVPRPTNPRNTCVVLQGENPPEEVLFVHEDGSGVMHYLPEDVGTCHVKAVKKLGDSFGFILSCGHSMVSPFNDYPHYCPWCGAKVVSE